MRHAMEGLQLQISEGNRMQENRLQGTYQLFEADRIRFGCLLQVYQYTIKYCFYIVPSSHDDYRHVILDSFPKYGKDHPIAEIGTFQLSRIFVILITCAVLLIFLIRGIETYQKNLGKVIKGAICYLVFCLLWVILFAIRVPQMTLMSRVRRMGTKINVCTKIIIVELFIFFVRHGRIQ